MAGGKQGLSFERRLLIVAAAVFQLGYTAYLYPSVRAEHGYTSVTSTFVLASIEAIPTTIGAVLVMLALIWVTRWVMAGRNHLD